MRRVLFLLMSAALCGAPAAAQAGVHMHLPKKHHRREAAADPVPAGSPGADVPDAAWTSVNTRR